MITSKYHEPVQLLDLIITNSSVLYGKLTTKFLTFVKLHKWATVWSVTAPSRAEIRIITTGNFVGHLGIPNFRSGPGWWVQACELGFINVTRG